jgi:hypothetical protein
LNNFPDVPHDEAGPSVSSERLASVVRLQVQHAVDGARDGLKVYESLRNLNEVIGTQYSERVLYELIQNAHDAHSMSDQGKIAVKLIVESPERGILYIANRGMAVGRV